MRTLFLLLTCLLAGQALSAQQRFIVFYADKGLDAGGYFAQQELALSSNALAHRRAAGIPFSYEDVPVREAYPATLRNAGVQVLRNSRWLNASLIETTLTPAQLKELLPQIRHIRWAGGVPKPGTTAAKDRIGPRAGVTYDESAAKTNGTFNYGATAQTVGLLGLDYLHDQGYTGAGVTIGFLDAGYSMLNTSVFFDSLMTSGRLLATYDFWDNAPGVFHKDAHGTYCSSLVAGNFPGRFVGMAPRANLLLAITDDIVTETPQDEFQYAAGLEWADSIGAQVISASISYKTFDAGYPSYVYADMDGNTAISTIAADIAASKGLLIVNGAGNSGTICAPCDADSILCVGGARLDLSYDNRSSIGPSADGRVKPNVAGFSTNPPIISLTSNNVDMQPGYQGTSAATPFISGLAACLRQAHPSATVMQLKAAIEQSAHLHPNPTTRLGHGVPNARIADSLLRNNLLHIPGVTAAGASFRIFPNPAGGLLTVEGNMAIEELRVLSVTGGLVLQQRGAGQQLSVLDVSGLAPGVYFVRVTVSGGAQSVLRMLKR